MLKGIPAILSPELLKVLCEMGHGDTIVISDGNYPAESMGKDHIVVRLDGHGVTEILDAILQVFPLDTFADKPVALMELPEQDKAKFGEPPIWKEYKEEIKKHDGRGDEVIEMVEKHAFYEASRKAYAIIATGEKAIYANIMLRKGVV